MAVQPRVQAAAPVGDGRFTLDYAPVLRGLSDYDQVNSSSQGLTARLDLPVGGRVDFNVWDRFQAGILDTRVVDPGGEYFFGLGHFRRNDLNAGARIAWDRGVWIPPQPQARSRPPCCQHYLPWSSTADGLARVEHTALEGVA